MAEYWVVVLNLASMMLCGEGCAGLKSMIGMSKGEMLRQRT